MNFLLNLFLKALCGIYPCYNGNCETNNNKSICVCNDLYAGISCSNKCGFGLNSVRDESSYVCESSSKR